MEINQIVLDKLLLLIVIDLIILPREKGRKLSRLGYLKVTVLRTSVIINRDSTWAILFSLLDST